MPIQPDMARSFIRQSLVISSLRVNYKVELYTVRGSVPELDCFGVIKNYIKI